MRFILISIALIYFHVQQINAQSFTEVSREIGIDHVYGHFSLFGGGMCFFDFDNDDYEDIFITGGSNPCMLYHNNGDGSFTDITASAGLSFLDNHYTMGVVAGDIDNDGFRDLFITVWFESNPNEHRPNLLLRNNGDGTFSNISSSAGIQTDSFFSASAAMADFNLDGFLDIYVTNYIDQAGFTTDSNGVVNGFAHICQPNSLFMNNGDNSFTEMGAISQVADTGCGLAVSASDYNLNGKTDLYVVNDFGEWVVANQLYVNQYPAVNYFTNKSVISGADIGLYGMGIAVGDYDGDLDLDYYSTNLGPNSLIQNQGDDSFVDVTYAAGVDNGYIGTLRTTGWGTVFFDYDNDSYLDLFVANGYMAAASFIETSELDPNELFHNNQDGTFTDTASFMNVADEGIAHGCAVGDYDNDGDLDLGVVILDASPSGYMDPHIHIYKNELQSIAPKNWVSVKLHGSSSNADALGSHMILHAGGKAFLRELDGGSSHASQNSIIAHFGLDTISFIDSLVVYWPGGTSQTEYNIMLNNINHVTELPDLACLDIYEPNNALALAKALPTPSIKMEAKLCPIDPIDWYSYKSNSQTNMKINLHCLSANYQLRVYDSTKTFLAASFNSGNDAKIINLNGISPHTTYYISVSSQDLIYSSLGYCLKINQSDFPFFNENHVNINLEHPNNLIVFPKIASQHFNISSLEDYSYSFFNVNGQLIEQRKEKKAGRTEVSTSGLPAGVYFLNYVSHSTSKSFKINVIH